MVERQRLRPNASYAPQRGVAPIVMGIIIIILGGLSFLGSLFDLVMVPMMNMQVEMMQEMQSQVADPNEQAAIEQMQQMMTLPDWYASFMLVFTLISLVILLGYIISGVLLVIRHAQAVLCYYLMATLLTISHVVKIGAAVYGESQMMLLQSFTSIIGIGMEIILLLLVVFLVKNKDLGALPRTPRSDAM